MGRRPRAPAGARRGPSGPPCREAPAGGAFSSAGFSSPHRHGDLQRAPARQCWRPPGSAGDRRHAAAGGCVAERRLLRAAARAAAAAGAFVDLDATVAPPSAALQPAWDGSARGLCMPGGGGPRRCSSAGPSWLQLQQRWAARPKPETFQGCFQEALLAPGGAAET